MKRLILGVLLLSLELFALSLEGVIEQALEKNPSLASLSHRIEASKSAVDISNQFSNPALSFTTDTLDADERMHKQTLTLQQKVPFYGKRDAQLEVSQASQDVIEMNLVQAKVNLVNEIKNQAYNIWELEQLLDIIKQYENLTKQNIELSESYTSTSKNQHMGIMSAQLSLTDLKIQRSVLKSKIYSAYARLSYLAAFEVTKLEVDISIEQEMPSVSSLQGGLKNNLELKVSDKEIAKNQAMIKNAEVNNYPDVNLVAGYSYRQNYDDYLTFGFGMSLPIYATEDYKEQEQRTLILAAQSKKQDTSLKINAEFMSVYMQMKSEYEIYHLIHDDALPQIAHMFELTNSSISTGGDLFKYIDILVQKLKLEQKSMSAIASYNRAYAKISALRGEIK